jgi:hypothetical protein
MNEDYSDIIDMPHHVSAHHPQMPMINRAAQFAPFSALNGLDNALDDTSKQKIAQQQAIDDYLPDNDCNI